MTDSIRIRPYEDSDASELFAAVHESLHELWPWMPFATASYSLADASSWIRTARDGTPSDATLYSIVRPD